MVEIEKLRDPLTREAAFTELVRELTPKVYAMVRRIVLYHDDADDVLQNTFMKAWLSLDTFRGESQASTWIYRIAYNECLTHIERQSRLCSLDDESTPSATAIAATVERLTGDPYFDGDEAEATLQAAIAQLPEKQRIVFNLKYFEEMKYEEMSRILGTSVGALKASYHLAVGKIKAFLGEKD